MTKQKVDILISKNQPIHVLAIPWVYLYSYCGDTVVNNIKHKHTLTALTDLAFLAGP